MNAKVVLTCVAVDAGTCNFTLTFEGGSKTWKYARQSGDVHAFETPSGAFQQSISVVVLKKDTREVGRINGLTLGTARVDEVGNNALGEKGSPFSWRVTATS